MKKKLILASFLALCAIAFYYFELGQYFTLDAFRARQAQFEAAYADNPFPILAGFFLLYVAVTALSLPGAAIMTLAAGALFGLVTGTLIVSFASTIGATLAFLSARFILHDWVQGKFGHRLKAINQGIEKDGAFYLFTIRMIPVFPFFIVNLVMGLTKMRLWTYFWVSQLGMIAGTIIFVNAGTQLAQIESTADLITPALLGSFAALAIFPWIAKRIIAYLKGRKAYEGYARPKNFDRNLIVIGAGAAGLVSSYIAAMLKANVTLIEGGEMGGDCLNTGCVPSKALIKSAKAADMTRHGDKYGLFAAKPQVDFPALMSRIRKIIADIEPHDSVERYTGLGVDVVKGWAKFIDPWTVEISRNNGEVQRLSARKFIIATGAAPILPPLKGFDGPNIVTSENMWDWLERSGELPQKIAIMGGGPIGCELATAFQKLGADVTIIEMADRILAKEDSHAADIVAASMREIGVDLLMGHKVVAMQDENIILAEKDGQEVQIKTDMLLVAIGRRARLSGFGLEELGLDVAAKGPINDEFLATKMPHIFMAGDVAGRQQFTHGAAHEAYYAATNALFGGIKKSAADYSLLPRVTYTDPEIAGVGLTQESADEQGIEYDLTIYEMDDLDRAITESETKGRVTMLTAKGSDRLLGVTIIGHQAGEMIAMFALAMRQNIKAGKIAATILPYPTWNEANKFVIGQYRLARKPEKLLNIMTKYWKWRL
ncbi:pyridine nucleotide-disulfide oxidoreductase [Sphingorhabdus lutea]|uniref:Pyridine nucleotide-disulfide oxidoreductase n=1 Tax=Sphingorhabdus lutea TaxID=1913578 RepID=A0A1L3J9E8_9SPHN|nr:FAD-dependent oxidoreductase [Sphingorhabdus lutea]APG61740.1 pyridine nucleotide-disulfide oxidoreductase [Sphingorhabdus lutea]